MVKKETQNMKIEVGYPECVHIELVQGNDLRNYEVFAGLSSIFSTAAAGFWVAYMTVDNGSILFWVSLVFTLMTLSLMAATYHYRAKMHGTKIIKRLEVS
jgi:hypothetical protein